MLLLGFALAAAEFVGQNRIAIDVEGHGRHEELAADIDLSRTVGWFTVRISDPGQAAQVGAAIDKRFANSLDETKAQSEKEFQMGFMKQIADINYIVTRILVAVFVALLFATGSTMMQSVRERIPELAVLKTIGFSNRSVLSLVLAESILLIVLGGIGCARDGAGGNRWSRIRSGGCVSVVRVLLMLDA